MVLAKLFLCVFIDRDGAQHRIRFISSAHGASHIQKRNLKIRPNIEVNTLLCNCVDRKLKPDKIRSIKQG